jgi:hypothetical protein
MVAEPGGVHRHWGSWRHCTLVGDRWPQTGHHRPAQSEAYHPYCKNNINIGDDSAVSLDVHNHLWNYGGDEIDVSQGQVGKEEAHGSVEMGITVGI